MDLGITGKWALVCGASKGLGFGCAQALVAEGVHVVIVARSADPLEQAAQQLRGGAGVPAGTQVLAVAADIATAEGRAKVFAAHRDFDIVVNNAGGPPPGDFRDWGREDWLKAIDANMLAPIELIKATVDGMAARGFGRIVNITSGAVKAPIGTLGLSNGARSGLTGFVAGLARSPKLAAGNVTINNLLPGAFDTDRLRGNMEGAAKKAGQTLEAVMDGRRKTIPSQRFGNAEEFGAICAFLCSQQASYIVGQNILADGGAYPGTF
ncbi:MAG TPA: SDR family oxidoreductase [Ramlibacter sp.]|jgi:3-oxoacyl-[acyl-carrier protein] reductase|nr:SDR family oxidoreductase [Ramlibacter sp.]